MQVVRLSSTLGIIESPKTDKNGYGKRLAPGFWNPGRSFVRKTEGQRILSSSDASTLPWVTPMKRFTSVPSF